jgi:hypothetical protein
VPVSYSQFLPEVLPYLPACSEPAAFSQIRNAAIEFADRTDILRYAPDPQVMEQDVGEYDIEVPANHDLARVLTVWAAGIELQAASEDSLAARFGTDWRTATGGARYYVLTNSYALRLCPLPTETVQEGLNMVLSLRPKRTSTVCDDILWERYGEPIAAGARFRLALMKGQPFYDPQAALLYRTQFMAGVGTARVERNRLRTRPLLSMRPSRGYL